MVEYNSWIEYYSKYKNNSSIENFGKLISPVASTISFINDEKYIGTVLGNSNIIGLIGPSEICKNHKEVLKLEFYIHSDSPLKDFVDYYELWLEENKLMEPSSISSTSVIHESASVSKYNVTIEDDVIIENNVVIKENVVIKKGTIIRSNCVVGSEGFEVIKIDNKNKFIRHNGSVLIGEHVQLQENCIIDKGVYGQETSIGNYSMLDKHVHVGHNARIGDNALITSGSIIGGNTVIGNNLYVGLGCIVSNRLTIGNNVKIRIGSTVIQNIENNEEVSGHFAIPHKQYLKQKIMLNRMLKNKGK